MGFILQIWSLTLLQVFKYFANWKRKVIELDERENLKKVTKNTSTLVIAYIRFGKL